MKSDQSLAAGLETALQAVDSLDVETLRSVLRNVIQSVYNFRDDAGLAASIADDLDGYDLLPYGNGDEANEEDAEEFVAWTDGRLCWHAGCIKLDEDDVEFRGLTAGEAASGRHAGEVCDACGLPLTERTEDLPRRPLWVSSPWR